MANPLKIAVCGAGAWGTAMALHLGRLGHDARLLPRRSEQADQLRADGENRDYLPGARFDGAIRVESEDARALDGAEAVFFAAPSYAMRQWADRIRNSDARLAPAAQLVSLAKGLELETRQTPCAILAEAFPGRAVGCLSGPTFAGEVAAGKPTAMTLALGGAEAAAEALQNAISGPKLRIYLSDDLPGVELGGCLKNVYAVAAGCCQGLQLGDNALAALLTRALAEMVRVGASMGAKAETFYGLSGFGDLVATCHGPWSRNRGFGEAIARGRRPAEIIASQKTAVEGYRTARSFHEECAAKGIEAPILEQAYRICYEDKPPLEALVALMSRDLKRE